MSLPGYDLGDLIVNVGVRYYFESTGTKNIIKIIDYSAIDFKHDVIKTEKIFNLGFVDLDENGETVDDVLSENGDAYKVFIRCSIPYHIFLTNTQTKQL